MMALQESGGHGTIGKDWTGSEGNDLLGQQAKKKKITGIIYH